jgi:PAB1-binding protein PBP1
MSSKDKTLIADMMDSFVSDVPANPFVSFCVACNKGVIKEEMVYEKGKVFHKDCFTKHGSNFPPVNQELLSVNTNAKVQLVQLKNLKVRMSGGSNQGSTKPKTKTKKISKRKTKKRLSKTHKPRKRNSSKKKKSKRSTVTKRKKRSQNPKRSKRKGTRKRPSRRIRKKTRNRR